MNDILSPDSSPTPLGQNPAYQYIPADLPIPVLYETETQRDDAVAWVRLFTPDSSWAWYITEWDRNDLCFGLVDGMYLELGYFALSELREARGPLGLPIERDLHFVPTSLGLVRAKLETGDL